MKLIKRFIEYWYCSFWLWLEDMTHGNPHLQRRIHHFIGMLLRDMFRAERLQKENRDRIGELKKRVNKLQAEFLEAADEAADEALQKAKENS